MISNPETLSTFFLVAGFALAAVLLVIAMRPQKPQGLQVHMGQDATLTLRKTGDGIVIGMDEPRQLTEEEFFLDRRRSDPQWWDRHVEAVRRQREMDREANPPFPFNDVLTEDLWRSFILLVYQPSDERRRILDVIVSQGVMTQEMADNLLQQADDMAPHVSRPRSVVSRLSGGEAPEDGTSGEAESAASGVPAGGMDGYYDAYPEHYEEDFGAGLDDGDWDMEI